MEVFPVQMTAPDVLDAARQQGFSIVPYVCGQLKEGRDAPASRVTRVVFKRMLISLNGSKAMGTVFLFERELPASLKFQRSIPNHLLASFTTEKMPGPASIAPFGFVWASFEVNSWQNHLCWRLLR